MKRKGITILLIMIAFLSVGFGAEGLIRNINIMGNLNPLLPFSFTYNYTLPSEWQVELLLGTTLNPQQLSSAFSEAATGTFITSGEIGLKFGMPGDLILFVGWPWLGGIFSVSESLWLPELDVSVLVPITLGVFSGSAYTESFSFNAVLKKSLQPVRFSGGFNFLASPQFSRSEFDDEVSEVGQGYLGLGLEWAVNPYIRLLGEFRYQFISVLFDTYSDLKFEMFPVYANQVLGIGFEYILDFPQFSMKASAGYAINLGIFDQEVGVTYGTHGIHLGFSFLFPFPWRTP